MNPLGAVLAGALVAFGSAAAAESARDRLFARQLAVLDGRAATQYEHSARLKPQRDPATSAAPERIGAYSGAYRGRWIAAARDAARRHAIPEDLFLKLVQQESGWNPGAVSHKGALGLAQLMPQTARRLGVDPRDPHQNLDGGARYLAQQFRRFQSWRLALAAYNAGPGAVERYGGVPPYRETQGYVRAILGS